MYIYMCVCVHTEGLQIRSFHINDRKLQISKMEWPLKCNEVPLNALSSESESWL
jgi:hypothetical protein